MSERTLNLIQNNDIRWVDLRFTDTKGKEQHVSIPASAVDEDFFDGGKMFDGSSISGWKGINESDMILMPDDSTAIMDPFTDDPTVIVRCDIVEPATMQGYDRDPRSIAKKAEAYLASTGLGDTAFFGPEPEFFVFDDVKWDVNMSGASYAINAEEAAWSSNLDFEDGNTGHRPRVKGGYFPVPPVDSLHDIRAAMCSAMEQMGLDVEVHHHEVGTAGQCEIGVKFNTLVSKADEVQILKYCVLNVAHAYGKTATFMPKPLVGDNGSGMHVHQSIAKGGDNTFAGDGYAGLSTQPSITLAASLSTLVRSMLTPTHRPTATIAWFPVSKRPSCWPTRRATAPHRFAFLMSRHQGQAYRGSLPRPHRQSLSRFRRDVNGRYRRYSERDSSRRCSG